MLPNLPVSVFDFAGKPACALAGIAALTVTILAAQTPTAPQWEIAAGGKMAFEVASIRQSDKFTKPSFPLDTGDAYANTGGRFSANFPVTVFIQFAYKIRLTSEQTQTMLAELPKWVANDRFSITAKSASSTPTKDQMRLMMQSLLADRFHLAVHFETRDMPVLALSLIKAGTTGPKLRPHAEGASCDSTQPEPMLRSGGAPEVFPPICGVTSLHISHGFAVAGSRNTTLESLASALPSFGNLERPVVDRTGLNGRFDYRLEWAPEGNSPKPSNAEALPEVERPTFLQAVREQLGLKLESSRGPVQTLVIGRIERPSEN